MVSVNNLPKSTTPHLPPVTLLETSKPSHLMNTPLSLIRSHLSANLAIAIFVGFAVSVHTSTPKQLPPSPLPLFTPSLSTAISDFRPISVTPLLSRVAERILVRKWLLPAIPTHMLADQFGFRPSGSTQCALINMLPQCSRTVIMSGV